MPKKNIGLITYIWSNFHERLNPNSDKNPSFATAFETLTQIRKPIRTYSLEMSLVEPNKLGQDIVGRTEFKDSDNSAIIKLVDSDNPVGFFEYTLCHEYLLHCANMMDDYKLAKNYAAVKGKKNNDEFDLFNKVRKQTITEHMMVFSAEYLKWCQIVYESVSEKIKSDDIKLKFANTFWNQYCEDLMDTMVVNNNDTFQYYVAMGDKPNVVAQKIVDSLFDTVKQCLDRMYDILTIKMELFEHVMCNLNVLKGLQTKEYETYKKQI